MSFSVAKFSVTKQRKLWWMVSGTLAVLSVLLMGISLQTYGYPINPGLDFVGGTRLQVERNCSTMDCSQSPLTVNRIREILETQDLANSSVQIVGDQQQGVSIRTPSLNPEQRDRLEKALNEALGPLDPSKKQIDSVGPLLGRETLLNGLLALGLSFLGIVLYLAFRFKWDYAFLAIVALFHDVLLTAGCFAGLGLWLGTEVDSLFIVALLTITGFSVNDTVVIYDRIREVMSLNPEGPIDTIVDEAVQQTLGRSINTTFTTLLTLFAIFLFGGVTLKDFALALIVGFVLGAYSSIFIASSLLGWWRQRQERAARRREGVDEPVLGSDVLAPGGKADRVEDGPGAIADAEES